MENNDDLVLDDEEDVSWGEGDGDCDDSVGDASVVSEPGPYENWVGSGTIQPYQFEPAADSADDDQGAASANDEKKEYLHDLALWLAIFVQ